MKNKTFFIIAFSLLFIASISCSSTMINESDFLPVKSGNFEIVGKMSVETEDFNEKVLLVFVGDDNEEENEMLYFFKDNLFGVSVINKNGEELNYKINVIFNLDDNGQSNVGKVAFILKDTKRNVVIRFSNDKAKIKASKSENNIQIELFYDSILDSQMVYNILQIGGIINIGIE